MGDVYKDGNGGDNDNAGANAEVDANDYGHGHHGGDGSAGDGGEQEHHGGHRVGPEGGGRAAPHPPPLEAPGGSQSPFAVSQALANDEAVLHHNGEARVRPHHDVLLLDLSPLLLSTAVPVNVASKTELS